MTVLIGGMTMALGDQLGHDSGQVTGTRVLPSTEQGEARIEVSFETRGRLLDLEAVDIGTYVSVMGRDGVLRGEGQGCVMTSDGATATWTGQGVGRARDDGATSFRGSIFYRTTSEQLARLNGIAAVFEYETDASGKTESKIYEWK